MKWYYRVWPWGLISNFKACALAKYHNHLIAVKNQKVCVVLVKMVVRKVQKNVRFLGISTPTSFFRQKINLSHFYNTYRQLHAKDPLSCETVQYC